MCRSADYYDFDSVKVRSFFVRLSDWKWNASLPESLTLLYLPRISESALEVSGSWIRPDSPAFVTLHRVVGAEDAVYGSREWVRAGEGVRFEVYSSEEKLLKGILRREEDDDVMGWRLDCKCALPAGRSGDTAAVAEICVGVEGQEAMTARVEMKRRRRMKNRRMSFDAKLEEIPEERETEREFECCRCGGVGVTAEVGGGNDDGERCEMGEMEGSGWAIDVGIWVACLGVGYLVSKASSKSLRRMRIF